jgi:hypothetical protein
MYSIDVTHGSEIHGIYTYPTLQGYLALAVFRDGLVLRAEGATKQEALEKLEVRIAARK